MESVTVSELNRQTAKVLERVKAGESVEISEYGRPVARIMPAAPTTGVPLLDRLTALGRATLCREQPSFKPHGIGEMLGTGPRATG